MAEWQGIYKRYLTADEKRILTNIVESKKVSTINNRICFSVLPEQDQVFIDNLFREILHDYVRFKNIVFSKSAGVILQPEKAWSPMFTGVSPIRLSSLLEDKMIMYKDCTQEELDENLVSRSRFYYS